jgi:tRNA 2-selenouridine synthase
MAVQKINIETFLQLAQTNLVFDVRSEGEYLHAHIPGAKNLPLFNDEERKIVGTAYKQQSREIAIKIGLDFFGVKMRKMVEEVERVSREWVGSRGKKEIVRDKWEVAGGEEREGNGNRVKTSGEKEMGKGKWGEASDAPYKKYLNITEPHPLASPHSPHPILLHCWRGGMRSAGVAWLLDLYGFKVYTLAGGYKAYRKWVLEQFTKEYNLKIIGGYTGSGKTLLLHALQKEGQSIIDLEALANHKGSALGGMGQLPQPKQEMFENLLAEKLAIASSAAGIKDLANCSLPTENCPPPTTNCIYLEDESQRIGNMQIPMVFWYSMRKADVYFFDIPFEERLNYLTEEYAIHPKENIVNAIMRIQKRLGGLETKTAINYLLENNFKESFRILLKYYDKYYGKGLYNRENANELIKTIVADRVDTERNVGLLKEKI